MSLTGPETEVLQYGRPVRRRWPVVLVTVMLAVALTVAGAVVWAVGDARAPEERRALERCAVEAERAVTHAERRLSTMATYISPTLSRARGDLHRDLLALIGSEAAEQAGPVEAALARCRGVDVWPFSRGHRAARAAYVALLEAEHQRLAEVASDGSAFYDGYPGIRRLADAAAERLAG